MSTTNAKKTVCFLGDSICEHGHYMYALRSYLHNKVTGYTIYNCGLGGMRADRVTKEHIECELVPLKAEYAIVSFGVNDLGIWLYDSYLEISGEVLSQRKERVENYYKGIQNIVEMLKEKGIVPVLMSPFPVNELLEEKPDIPTVGDNEEKAQLINPWFYKRKTFININQALKGLNDWLKDYSQKENVAFIDTFDALRKYSLKTEGLFNQDGIHYSKKGGEYIARAILDATGTKRNKKEFTNDYKNDEIYLAERDDRSVAFINICRFGEEEFKDFSEKKKKAYVKKLIKNPETEEWLYRYGITYLKYHGKFEKTKEKLVELTEKYLQ